MRSIPSLLLFFVVGGHAADAPSVPPAFVAKAGAAPSTNRSTRILRCT